MTKRKYTEDQVDVWCKENDESDCFILLNDLLPKHYAKLVKLDNTLQKVLAEIRVTFPDACYYTASGGFTLMLGSPHSDDFGQPPQRQRLAWIGQAEINDGDF